MQVTRIPVDSGTIEMAVSEAQFDKAGEFYAKIQDLTDFTADIVWDGKKGGLKTPDGDGPHEVRFETLNSADFDAFIKSGRPEIQWLPVKAFIRGKQGEIQKGFTLFLGDVGKAYGWLDIPDFKALYYMWMDGATLVIVAEVP